MLLKELAKEFEFDCYVRNLSPRTVKFYQTQISYFLAFLERQNISEVEQIRPQMIKEFLVSYERRGNKPSYINDILKSIKCLSRYAFNEGYTSSLLTEKIKNLKQPKVLIHTFSDEEITKIINYYNGMDYLSIRNKIILMIFFNTGIRLGELINMRLDQIRDTYFCIYGKGRKERVVPKNPMVAKWLMKYLQVRNAYFQYRRESDLVFLSKNGKRLTEEGISKFIKNAAAAVNVNPMVRVSPHTCRHTFAQLQLKNGLDLYSLSRLLGHESVAITQRYLESMQDAQILRTARRTGVLAHL